MKKCEHKWIDMEDGSHDKFCVRCSKKAKQAVAYIPLPEIKVDINVIAPNIRTARIGRIGGTEP